MNNLDHNVSTDFHDGLQLQNDDSRESIEDSFTTIADSKSSEFVCQKLGCAHLRFHSETQYRKHILTHITLPSVIVPRLDISSSDKKLSAIPETKQESLKVRLKLTSQAGSSKPAFEFVEESLETGIFQKSSDQRSDLFLPRQLKRNIHCMEIVHSKEGVPGKGGQFFYNSLEDEVKTQPVPGKDWSTKRWPAEGTELDTFTSAASLGESDIRHKRGQEEDIGHFSENNPDVDAVEEETNDSEAELEGPLPSTAPPSPSPSEILRPQGYLAPEQLVDEDSCYSRSPPVSPTRMVEMNGSASTISGSDNDSGHSRSPAAFTGGSGTGSGGEEDSSAQQSFNWDELVEASTRQDGNEQVSTNDNGQIGESTHENVNDTVSSEITGTRRGSNILENDPLLLPENTSSADGEHENLNLLQNLTADPLHAEVDRGGETEYMSLDRLAVGPFCCEVCGERTKDAHILEEHKALAGHYKCPMQECAQIVWSTSDELAAHQSTVHGLTQPQVQQVQQTQQPPQQSSPPQTSPQGSAGTPPMQQLAQQVQRIPITPQVGYPALSSGQYTGSVPQPQISPQHPPQIGPHITSQLVPQMVPGQMPQRRPAMGFRMPISGQPYGPGTSSQQQPPFSGSIQPRPINTLVAQQPVRGQLQNRMPSGAVMSQSGPVPRGMAPMRGQKRSGPLPQSLGRGVMPPAAKQRRVEGMMPPQPDNGPGKKGDAKAVANILATRGITVTPAGSTRPGPQPGGPGRLRQNLLAPAAPQPVTTLNLNSAISITPTSGSGNGRQNNAGFAVPQVRSMQRQPVTTNVERPPRPPTVDLTGDGPLPPPGSSRFQMGPTFHRGRGRPSNISRTTCQICDKAFASPDMLNQHMLIHRGPGKLPFRCHLCNAQYPTQQGLQQHRQTYHKEPVGMGAPLAPGEEMVIPLVDLKQPGVAARLSSLGIHHCIPLSGLGNQSNGYFSLPVISIDGSRPSAAGNLRSLGASGVLSIGPIKLVPK